MVRTTSVMCAREMMRFPRINIFFPLSKNLKQITVNESLLYSVQKALCRPRHALHLRGDGIDIFRSLRQGNRRIAEGLGQILNVQWVFPDNRLCQINLADLLGLDGDEFSAQEQIG